MPLDLFPYQEEGARFLAPRDRAALFDEMGVGKTAQAIRALDLADARRIVIVCPAAVREVWAGEFKKFAQIKRRVMKGRDIQDLNVWMRGKADVLLLSYEMAVKWARRIEGDLIDAVVFDECFPYDTPVLTEHGDMPIGRIVEERLPVRVWSQGKNKLELKSVSRYIKKEVSSPLVRVVHAHGVLTCTGNHKVWVDGRGLTPAEEILAGDTLRMVPRSLPHLGRRAPVLQQKLLGKLAGPRAAGPRQVASFFRSGPGGPKGKTPARRFGEDATAQFRSGVSRQSGCGIQVAERIFMAGEERRERFCHRAAAAVMQSPGPSRVRYGVPGPYRVGQGAFREPASRLQGRHRDPRHPIGYRGRRQEPRHPTLAIPGRPENFRTVGSRVDRVEVSKQGSGERTAVYNIEVVDNHNYFAGGVLVGNCHYLKSEESARTRALLGSGCGGKDGLARWGAHVWFLTGTPNPNDAADVWSIMRFCEGTTLSKKVFCNRYYKAKVGAYSLSHSPRKETLPELKDALASFSLRRTKKQAGLQLPPIWLTTTTVDGDTAEIRSLLREHPGMEQAVLDAVEKGGLSFLDAQHIATLRRLVGEAKAPAFLELLKGELHDGLDKVVVFGIHRRALDIIQNGLHAAGVGCVRVDGQVSESDRADAVASFQGSDEARVFLGNIRAAGTGLTLTAAADVIMFESDWSPAGNAQALMRVHRIGQERSVRARFISLAGSIDEHVSNVVARKTAAIAQIQGAADYA